jgi:hypothetical protein
MLRHGLRRAARHAPVLYCRRRIAIQQRPGIRRRSWPRRAPRRTTSVLIATGTKSAEKLRKEMAMAQALTAESSESGETHRLRAARCWLSVMLLVLSTAILLAASVNG